ncbi:MAG: TRAP transporter small permease subunit [Alphaproteobacteria bacterium]
MPSLDFALPHWLYYAGLVFFPLIAWHLARKPVAAKQNYSNVIGYFVLITGGIIGLHRYYARRWTGIFYSVIFLAILFSNNQQQISRTFVSDLDNQVKVSQKSIERSNQRIEENEPQLPELQQQVTEAEAGSFALRSATRKLERAEATLEKARADIINNQQLLETSLPQQAEAQATMEFWDNLAKYGLWLILAGLLVDIFLLPRLIKAANQIVSYEDQHQEHSLLDQAAIKKAEQEEEDSHKPDHEYVSTGWTGKIDRLSLASGEFVSYWAVIAVFVYYFEVISRYVFNSPTSWAHESMYLMFGMQYLIAGSYSMLCEGHVRVDIFYSPLSKRHKAVLDILTSIFFFIFAGTLMVTAYIFAFDSITVPAGNALLSQWARGDIDFAGFFSQLSLSQWTDSNIRWGEISFNEWEIPLWPMKWMMVVGGLLLVLQGVSKLVQNVNIVIKGA